MAPSDPLPGRPLRVAVFTESFLPYLSGVTISVDALARGLGVRGHRVMVAAPRPRNHAAPASHGASGPDPEYAWLPSYQLPRLVPRGYRMPWPLPRTAWRRRVDRFAPDVVHAHSPFVTGALARLVARRHRAPLVFTHHTRFGEYRHYLGPLAAVGGRLVEWHVGRFWRRCSAVIAPSAQLAAEIDAKLNAEVGERQRPVVRAIPTGIDLPAVRALVPSDPRPAHGWPPDAIVAVTLGRLALEKNVEVLLDAFAVAAGSVPRLRLLVIGSGPAAPQLAVRAERPDLQGRVGFTGLLPRSDALALLRSCDLFVFASVTETQGLVLAEAIACGLPVVALDGPGVRDTVRNGVDGVLVSADQDARAEPLGTAIAEVSTDDARRNTLARSARTGAERFSLQRSISRVEDLYRELLASSRHRLDPPE